MKQEIADKLVAALTSGEYTQGKGRLRTEEGGFCCLGVLCDLARKDGLAIEWDFRKANTYDEDGKIVTYDEWFIDGAARTLPWSVQEWAGTRWENGTTYDSDGFETNLAAMNDGGRTFAEIAAFIRENVEKL